MDEARPGTLDVIIITNGPGEVAGWVSPVCLSLAKTGEPIRVSVFLVPCPFATGREADVLTSLPGVSKVYRPAESLLFAIWGRRPEGFSPGEYGVVLHLGGDFWYSARIAQKLGFPALAYSDRSATWISRFSAFAVEDSRVRDKLISKGVPAGKVRVVGNLMIDGIMAAGQGAVPVEGTIPIQGPGPVEEASPRVLLGLNPDARCVLLLPGSRGRIATHFIPFLLDAAQVMAAVDKGIQFVLALSPFIPRETVESILEDMAAERNIKLVGPGERFLAMRACDLAISLPGSVTAELAFLGVPMIVTVPLRHWEVVPLPGALGLLGMIPGIGRLARYWGIRRATRKISYLALPNKRARRYIVPEMVGRVGARDVAIAALELLESPARREAMSRELRQAMGEPGAAGKLVEMVMSVAGRQGSPGNPPGNHCVAGGGGGGG
ncbi:MAG TPA: hypothetical protein GX506_11205 [Firmicutes bacterium]|nr:hypothetical protein [Bacillota bacterium]